MIWSNKAIQRIKRRGQKEVHALKDFQGCSCCSLGDMLLEQAVSQYPCFPYNRLVLGGIALTLGYSLYYLRLHLGIAQTVGFSVIGLVLCWVGMAADIASTYQAARLKPEFDKRQIHYPMYETNILLPRIPTLRDLLFNITTLGELALSFGFFLVPEFGVSVFFLQAVTAAHNHQIYLQLRYMLVLCDSKPGFLTSVR